MKENNKLIAEFMGYKISDNQVKDENGFWEDMNFHKSWDWLMPVIKEINEQISPNVRGLWRTITNPYEFSIEDVYKQVVEFIEEYKTL